MKQFLLPSFFLIILMSVLSCNKDFKKYDYVAEIPYQNKNVLFLIDTKGNQYGFVASVSSSSEELTCQSSECHYRYKVLNKSCYFKGDTGNYISINKEWKPTLFGITLYSTYAGKIGKYSFSCSASNSIGNTTINGKQYEDVEIIFPSGYYSCPPEFNCCGDTLYFSRKTGIIKFMECTSLILYAKGVY